MASVSQATSQPRSISPLKSWEGLSKAEQIDIARNNAANVLVGDTTLNPRSPYKCVDPFCKRREELPLWAITDPILSGLFEEPISEGDIEGFAENVLVALERIKAADSQERSREKIAQSARDAYVLGRRLPRGVQGIGLYHPAEFKEPCPSDKINNKLDAEFARAQEHMRNQKPTESRVPPLQEEASSILAALTNSHKEASSILAELTKSQSSDPSIGICTYLGGKGENQDAHMNASWDMLVGENSCVCKLFGVIDGHGKKGRDVSSFIAKSAEGMMKPLLTKYGTSPEGVVRAAKEFCFQMDTEIFKKGTGMDPFASCAGAVVVFCLQIGNELWTINVGDCRAILKAGDHVLQLSVDATPDDPRFKRSIEKRGGQVQVPSGSHLSYRCQELNTARSIGDKNSNPSIPFSAISCLPKITRVDLGRFGKEPIYLMLVSDGISDVLNTEEIASHLSPQQEDSTLNKKAQCILLSARRIKTSTDDATVLIALLSPNKSKELVKNRT